MTEKLSHDEAEQRIIKLRELINDYRYHYHVLDESTMSEAAADSLKHELDQLEKQYPDLITPDSPTQRVAGRALDKFTKVTHERRMISLADVFSHEEIEAWAERARALIPGGRIEEYFTDIKMDGLAMSLHYENGVFKQAVTRGDGLVGEDVTMNVRTVENVPLRLRGDDYPEKVEVRGEVVIFKKDFDALNEKREKAGEKPFANPRNLAAGSIRQLDPKIAASRKLKFMAYDLVTPDSDTHQHAYERLHTLGFQTSGEEHVYHTLEEVFTEIERLRDYRKTLKFNTDGMVIKINDRKIYDQLGIVGKTPRAAVAFKFPAEEVTTKILDIVISIGRTGAATPVAILEPCNLAGSVVKAASLHNADEIARLDVRVGDTVIIFKAGDIIPQVKRVLTELREDDTKPFNYEQALHNQYPELDFYRPEGEVVYRVKGETTDLILKRQLEYYASKPALNIEGLGTKNVEALVDSGLVKSLPDLYRLKATDVEKLERFAELSARNLTDNIKKSKTPPLAKFITALGIRHVGAQTAIALANHFQTLDNLISAEPDELTKIPDIGEVVADSILAYFADEDNLKMLEELRQEGVEPELLDLSNAPLTNQSFIISGTLESMGRELAEDALRAKGAKITSSVTKNTTALILGENPGKSKLDKATKLGIPTLDEAALLELIK